MHRIDLRRVDLNLLVVFDVLIAERSVTRAAARLGRTQSAISHALARLRGQVGDPLLVKVGGRMTPSPYAERLGEEVRPILRGIQRVLAPARAFEPATSDRAFRVAIPDLTLSLSSQLMARVRGEAPGVVLEWVARDAQALAAVAEGQIDIALTQSAVTLPEGVEGEEVGAFKWATFARRGHPATRAWGRGAWSRWPHVAVRIGGAEENPVAAAASGTLRKVAAWVPHFSAVAPLLARTDLLATLPAVVMVEFLDPFGLVALPTPFPLEPLRHRLVWSRRLAGDPAIGWIRAHVREVLANALAAAEAVPVVARVRSRASRGRCHAPGRGAG